MTLRSFFTFLPSILAGFGLVHIFWKSNHNSIWGILLKGFLGIGLGLGITSCIYFFRLALFPGQGGYLFIGLGIFSISFMILVLRGRVTLPKPSKPNLSAVSVVQVIFLLSALFVLYGALRYSHALFRNSPHGDYDAQAIWNFRARTIYRLGDR